MEHLLVSDDLDEATLRVMAEVDAGEIEDEERMTAEARAVIDEELPGVLISVPERWRDAVAAIYPEICMTWPGEQTFLAVSNPGGRGLFLATTDNSFARFLPGEMA